MFVDRYFDGVIEQREAVSDGEVFLPVVGYERLYEVSRNAFVRSLARTVNLGYAYRGLKQIPLTTLRMTVRDGRGFVALPSHEGAVPGAAKWRNQTKRDVIALAYEAWVEPIPKGFVTRIVDDVGDIVDRTLIMPRSLHLRLNHPHEKARDNALIEAFDLYMNRKPAKPKADGVL